MLNPRRPIQDLDRSADYTYKTASNYRSYSRSPGATIAGKLDEGCERDGTISLTTDEVPNIGVPSSIAFSDL